LPLDFAYQINPARNGILFMVDRTPAQVGRASAESWFPLRSASLLLVSHCYASAPVMQWWPLYVCPSVCLSHAGTACIHL